MKLKNKNLGVRMPISMDSAMHKSLHKVSHRYSKTMGAIVREAITRLLADLERHEKRGVKSLEKIRA